jgi:hypothetical protein
MFERFLLGFFLLRPYRCSSCDRRFYANRLGVTAASGVSEARDVE